MTPKQVAKELREWAKAIDPNSNGTIRKRLEALASVVEGFAPIAKSPAALVPAKSSKGCPEPVGEG